MLEGLTSAWLAVVITWSHAPVSFEQAFIQRQTGTYNEHLLESLDQCIYYVHGQKADVGYCINLFKDKIVVVR